LATVIQLSTCGSMVDITQIPDPTQQPSPYVIGERLVDRIRQGTLVYATIAPFVPVRTKNKNLRWSRELMLVGSGTKPYES
jgi:hypothetical protein